MKSELVSGGRRAGNQFLPCRYVRVAGGQDDVKGKIFRIGHMGTVSDVELMGGIAATERVLTQNGAHLKTGAWPNAWA